MKKTIIYVIICIAIMLLSIGGTLLGVKLYNNAESKKYSQLVEEPGIKDVVKVDYELPKFTILVAGIYDTTITNEDIKDLQVYEISAVMNDGIYKDYYYYNGVKLKDVLEKCDIKNYNNVTFKSGGKLQVTFAQDEINDDVYLTFDVDGYLRPSEEPVALLAPDFNSRYSISDVVTLEFD